MTTTKDVCVLHWYAEPPYALTAVGVPGSHAAEAERKALAALGTLTFPPAWHTAAPELRTRVVRECRAIPTVGAWLVVDDERPGVDEADSWRRILAQLDSEWYSPGLITGTHEIVLDAAPPVRLPLRQWNVAPDDWLGLRTLTRLTSLVYRMPLDIRLDADEDLLDIFDRFSIGGLADPDFFDPKGS